MKKNILLKLTFISMILISGALFLLILIDYNKSQLNAFQTIAEDTLHETISQQQFSIKTLLNSELGLLKTLGNSIHLVEDNESIVSLLNNIEVNTHYSTLFWVDSNMIGISNTGNSIFIEESNIIKRALNGETVLSDPIYSEVYDQLFIQAATPSYDSVGNINGVVYGIYTPDKLKTLILTSFSDKGVTHIVNSQGQYIASTFLDLEHSDDINTDLATRINNAVFKKDSLEKAANDISLKQSGKMNFTINNEQYETAYEPLGINDWSIIVTVPLKDLIKSSSDFQERTFHLSLFFALIFLVIVLLFMWQEGRSKKKLYNTAYYDHLTGLPNLTKFKMDAGQLMKNFPNDKFSCIIFDILNFKLINDSFGNDIGDLILKEIGNLSNFYMNQRNGEVVIGRLHSDVFILFSKESKTKDSNAIKTFLINKSRSNASMFRNVKLDFYLGRYICEPLEDIDQVLERAKIAHSHAKNSIINEFTDYDFTIVKELYLINSILNEFDEALANNEFQLYIQPQFNAQTENISGAEILVRWIKDGKVKYRPDEFIPILEKSSDILRLDAYIREQAYCLLKKWQNENLDVPSLSVNVSRFDLLRPEFTDNLITLAEKYDIDASRLHLEITETAYVEDHIKMIDVVKKLQSHGFCIEMDDFGSGYSSLNILKDLPLDVIKLDMKFLNAHSNNANGEIIVTSIIEMAKKLNLTVIAEGTETRDQVKYLRAIGCNELQGYYFARPMPIEEFEQKIKPKH